MRQTITLLLAFTFTLGTLYGQDKKKSGPEFQFEKEVHKFGKIQEGTKAKHSFKFVNVGNEPLIIKNVKASCGCTTPHWTKKPVMPNDTGTVTAVYNSKGRPGGFHKAITIRSNANKPTKVLYIKGKAVKNLDEKKASPKQKEVSPVKKKKKGAQ